MVAMTTGVMDMDLSGSRIIVKEAVYTGMITGMTMLTLDGPPLTYAMCQQLLERSLGESLVSSTSMMKSFIAVLVMISDVLPQVLVVAGGIIISSQLQFVMFKIEEVCDNFD